MFKPNDKGIARIVKAFRYSIQGLFATYKTEEGFRLEVLIGIVVLPMSFFIADTVVEWLLLFITYCILLISEILNSAVEAAIDRFGGELHELSGKAKDAGSAAVLVAFVVFGVTWLSIIFVS